ncbi:MAG: DUF1566 domain-containing protein [Flavobacteriales bacterium]|nr:DUF1566 domain-containing protein [Flavobacteriales bacterium]
MKLFSTLIVSLAFSSILFAQAPQKMNYQGVARDNSGSVLANQNIALRLSILSGSISGTVEFAETQAVTTNDFGLFNVRVGEGAIISSNGVIEWGNDSHFLKVEMDAAGGSNYVEMGTSQLVSTPYAFYADKAGNMPDDGTAVGEMLYWDGSGWNTVAPGISGQPLVYCYGVPTWNRCLQVGDTYQGGIIAKILQPGQAGYDNLVPHGLIVAPFNQGTAVTWSNGSLFATGVTNQSYGSGNANTNQIVAIQGAGSYAAQLCADLNLNGYTDWYLPSVGEANLLNEVRAAVGLQGEQGFFWTSTEADATDAFFISFFNSSVAQSSGGTKNQSIRVRAVRSF